MSEQSQTTVIQGDVHDHSFTWTIVNFSKISEQFSFSTAPKARKDTPLQSRIFKFDSSTSSWRLRFYPRYKDVHSTCDSVAFALDCPSKAPDVYEVTQTMALIDSASEMCFIQKKYWFSVNRAQILAAKAKYLPNDTLTVKCQLKIVCKYEAMHTESQNASHLDSQNISNISSDFATIFGNQKFSDVIIRCDGSDFRAHKLILSARSPVFASMLQHDMLENLSNEVNISDIKATTMERLLHYIYGKKIENLLPVDCRELYEAADKYQLLGLKQDCAAVIVKQLNAEMVCEVARLADMHNDSSLFSSAQDFVKSIALLGPFVTSKAFVNFAQESPDAASRLIVR